MTNLREISILENKIKLWAARKTVIALGIGNILFTFIFGLIYNPILFFLCIINSYGLSAVCSYNQTISKAYCINLLIQSVFTAYIFNSISNIYLCIIMILNICFNFWNIFIIQKYYTKLNKLEYKDVYELRNGWVPDVDYTIIY